ncbi:MAG: chaperonin GroEL [Chloroflexota bacterium]|nr:chaperonin GroEL [Chloroflexota bacterium]MDE2931922.1 chaperonin GroEL [Chloroflexota bacterium]
MPKIAIFSEEARNALMSGIEMVAETVQATLGPKGRNVALSYQEKVPIVTHDGVTVAKEIELVDNFENMGAQLIIQAASKTNDIAGDGTTTATALAHTLITEGHRHIVSGANPMILKRGLEQAARAVVEELRKSATQISSKEQVTEVATVSAGDTGIGALIGEVMDRVGRDGLITVEEGQSLGISVEYAEGMEFDQGLLSPYFITDSIEMKAVVEDPYIFITDRKIESLEEILPLLERLVQSGEKNLAIIALEMDSHALAMLITNKSRGILNCLAVKVPGFGDRRKETLRDIAILTGGTLISEEAGKRHDEVEIEDLGRARRVVADKDSTAIIEGHGDQDAIAARINQIKSRLQDGAPEFDREKLEERIAKLSGGVAIIHVGAATEIEMKERRDRVDDALSATRAAVEEGIVPGGGVALINAMSGLDRLKLKGDEAIAIPVMRQALAAPLKRIALNAGLDASVISQEVTRLAKSRRNKNMGYNVLTGEYVDMIEAGIIDPLKVARSAVENATSVAGMVLTTEALVADVPTEDVVYEGAPEY